MKNYLRHIIVTALLVMGACVFFVSHANAQAVSDGATKLGSVEASVFGIDILGLLASIASKYPVVGSLIAFIGLARTFAKPLFSFIHAVVDLTPSKQDDALVNKVLLFFSENKVGKSIAYVLDYVASIKITPPAKSPSVNS